MAEYEVVIIGGGPAGLTAGLYLARAKRRAVLLEKENFGGKIKNVEWVENYPGFAAGVSGAQLASEMASHATRYGLKLEPAEVTGLEIYSSSRWVTCTGGHGYTAEAIIIAGGCRYKKLGVPGEKEFQGKGVFNCALCEGGQFANKVVVVCGGGDTGVTEALYLTRLASKVILIEVLPSLTASAILQERASSNPKLESHCGYRVEAITGDGKVEAIEMVEVKSGKKKAIKADGVLVGIGLEPNTDYLQGIVPLDERGQVLVDSNLQTAVPGIFAAGDIRCNSPRQVATAVGDGAAAALSANRFLKE